MQVLELVCAGTHREYDEKINYWLTLFGKKHVSAAPEKPMPIHHGLFHLNGDLYSPISLLGQPQVRSVDHTLFWLY